MGRSVGQSSRDAAGIRSLKESLVTCQRATESNSGWLPEWPLTLNSSYWMNRPPGWILGVRIEVHQILTDLMSEQNGHLCIVLSSHIFEDLEKVADNVSILKNGSLAFSATRDEVGAAYDVPMQRACRGRTY